MMKAKSKDAPLDDTRASGIRESGHGGPTREVPPDTARFEAQPASHSSASEPARVAEARVNPSSRRREYVRWVLLGSRLEFSLRRSPARRDAGADASTAGRQIASSDGPRTQAELTVGAHPLTLEPLRPKADGPAQPRGAALDGLAAPEDAISTSTPSTPSMPTDADHDVRNVSTRAVSDVSEEFDISEEELDAWEDLISSDDELTKQDEQRTSAGAPSVRGVNGPVKRASRGDLDASLHLLAEFAVRVAIGPLAPAWIPEVQRAAGLLRSAPPVSQDPTSLALLSSLGSLVEIGSREQVLQSTSELPRSLLEWPAWASDLASEAQRRERRILHELLLARDGLKARERERLEQEMSLERLRVAGPEELAAAFDISVDRARQLTEDVAAYASEREARPPEVSSSAPRQSGASRASPGPSSAVWGAVADLEQHSRAFADCDEDQRSDLRLARARRRNALSRVNLLLAENGEIELLEMLVPCAVTERIRRLRSWFGVDTEGASIDDVKTSAGEPYDAH
jgi:hypothetical protein